MQITLDIPDSLAEHFIASGKEPSRAALETLLVEGYRTGAIFEGEIRHALGYGTPMQVHALLNEHDVPLDFTIEDLEKDRETMRRLSEREASVAA
jgi:hypothetical protein